MTVPCEPAIIERFDALKLCKAYEKEIQVLRQELAMHDTLTNRSQISYEPLSESQIQEVRGQVKRFLAGELDDIELVNVRQIKETFVQFRKVVSTLEGDMEEKLRQKYALQEKPATAAGMLFVVRRHAFKRFLREKLRADFCYAVYFRRDLMC